MRKIIGLLQVSIDNSLGLLKDYSAYNKIPKTLELLKFS